MLLKKLRKIMAPALMAGITVLSLTGAGFGASDLGGHWASTQMNAWIGQGIIKGYPDGTVKPDASVTRAEFMAMVNKAYKLSGTSGKAYKDVNSKVWYSSVIDTAATAGYIGGYPDGTMRPDARISRNEAAVIIMKVSGLSGNATASAVFSDSGKMPSWAQAAVGAAYRKGAMSGYPDGTFGGDRSISRAEAVISLSRSVSATVTPTVPTVPTVPVSADRSYSDPGTYGNDSTQTIKGNATIKVSGVTLNNMVIEGDLIIAKEVSNGDATLKNVTVKGATYIYGGGPNSVRFTNVTSGKVYVSRDSGTVRLVLSGSSVIDKVIARSDLKLEESGLSKSGASYLSIESGYTSGVDVELVGASLEDVDMSASGSTLTADYRTTVTRFTVSARDTVVTLDSGCTVSRLIADAAVKVRGKGTISRADVNVSNVTFENTPKETTVKSGVTAPSTSNPYIQSFSPSDGSTSASLSTDIVITFSKTVRQISDTSLSNTNVDGLITLRSGSSSGSSVPFDATVTTSSGKTVITVDPNSSLSASTRYYISVEDVEDSDNLRVTGSRSATFTTAGNTAPRIESFSPASGAVNAAVGSNIVLTFSETVRKTSGNTTLSDSNVVSLINLRKTNSSGTSIAFNARVTVSSGKTILTIDPVSDLAYGQLYYVSISDLEDIDDMSLTGTTYATFTTVANPAPTVESFTPTNSATGVLVNANLTLKMSEVVRLPDNTPLSKANVKPLITLKKGSASGETVLFDTDVATVSDKTVITVDPTADLLPNQVYYWAISGLEDVTDLALLGTPAASFTTAPLADPVPTIESISPSTGSADAAAVGTNIVITFSEVMRALNHSPLENNTVDALITFKTPNSNGTKVNFDATVDSSSGKTVITIDPTDNLAYNTVYYVAVTGVEDSATQTVTGNATFTTAKAAVDPTPTIESISPGNNSVDVAINEKIVISYSEIMRTLDKSLLDDTAAKGLISLKTGESAVEFSAAVNTVNSKTVITITPQSPLSNNTAYSITISEVEDSAGQRVSGSATFTTVKAMSDPLTALTMEPSLISFSGGTTSYEATVENDVASVTVTPTAASDNTFTISGAVSGVGSPLQVGLNTILITVSKVGCKDLVYTISITRK